MLFLSWENLLQKVDSFVYQGVPDDVGIVEKGKLTKGNCSVL